ncbi:MAG: response regulator transcription factor [Chloroflexi bacterium]|nr:response regulator transcription factor [Chloroflexota bacterium]
MTRVLIADDHKLFRQGLIGIFETREEQFEVVGEASSGREALEMVERLLPDIVLMDIYMPDGDGLQALRQIRERFPQVKVVMLTSSEKDEHLYQAVQYGAAGYLLKNLDAGELFDLIDSATQGEAAMTREMAARLLKNVAKRAVDPERGEEVLTERELAVLRLVAVGASNQEIASKLTISINTVKTHIRSILDKLQLENRTQAANYAIQRGLVYPNVD